VDRKEVGVVTLLVNLLILVVVAVIVFYLAKWLMGEAELDPPIRKIVLLLLGVMFLIWLINIFSGGSMWPLIEVGRGPAARVN
jgi:hypothetical protein